MCQKFGGECFMVTESGCFVNLLGEKSRLILLRTKRILRLKHKRRYFKLDVPNFNNFHNSPNFYFTSV